LWFDTNTGQNKLKVYDGSAFNDAGSAVNGTAERQDYVVGTSEGTYTGSTTVFPATYEAGFVDVYLNGIKLMPEDFTATNGTSITLGSAAQTSDTVSIVGYGTFNVAALNANNLTSGTIPDARFPSALPAIDGSALTGINTDLVSDTTPQLGGDLDTQGFDINMDAGTFIDVGGVQTTSVTGYTTGVISTDGTRCGTLYIMPDDTKNLYLGHGTSPFGGSFSYTNYAAFIAGGAASIYHDGNKKLETTATGISVTGNVAVTSGNGIDFSATANTSATGATTASELLDDYEEGTWTPTVGQGTITADDCTYTKIGDTVHVRARILSFSNRTSSGGVTVSGLPFASSSDNRAAQGILARYVNSGGDAIVAYVGTSTSDLLLFTTNENSAYTTVTHNALTSSQSLFFISIAYKAA